MIRLLLDTAADFTLKELEERNISLVPLTVMINEKSYLDTVELERNDFYKMLEDGADFPKTSQPSPQMFAELFEDAKEKGDDVICITISSALSGTCQSAHLAKNMVEYDNIYIIDSLSATHGIRLMVEYAQKLISENLSAAEVVERVENMKSRVRMYAYVDTLEFLCKGGRVSKTTAAIGTIANVKPLITVTTEGKVAVTGKCIGRVKALNQLMKTLQEKEVDTDFPLYTLYAYGTESCEKLEKKLEAENYTVAGRLQIGSTIGAHVGPGATAVIFVEK